MVGIDTIEVARMRDDADFLNRIALPAEKEYILLAKDPSLRKQKIAALWAVKEAVMKALELGCGSGVSFTDIELRHESGGKPYVELSGVALNKYTTWFADKKLEVSLSHTKERVVAIAILLS